MPDAFMLGMTNSPATYQIDSRWRIVRATAAFCSALRCTEQYLIGRDVRDMVREDWRLDFRTYVARALMGAAGFDATLPMLAPGGEHGWFKHTLQPVREDGLLVGYRATVTPLVVQESAPPKRWWYGRTESQRAVWNFDERQLTRAS